MTTSIYHEGSSEPAMAAAPGGAASESLVERLARFFRAHPNEFVDGRRLASIAGYAAWRTRVSELRRAPYFMAISNRTSRVESQPGRFITVSEYRYVVSPSQDHQPEAGA